MLTIDAGIHEAVMGRMKSATVPRAARLCTGARRNPGKLPQCLKKLERVKGIEPSYSAWKAAALPLSYTRARPFNYHAMEAASTAMHRALETACVPGMFRPGRPLNMPRFAAY